MWRVLGFWIGIGVGFPLTLFGSRASHAAVSPTVVHANFISSVGRKLDPDFPRPSLLLEPSLSVSVAGRWYFRLHGLFERPFDPYKKPESPLVDLLATYLLQTTPRWEWGPLVQAAGLETHAWSTEGLQIRNSVGLLGRVRPAPGLTLELVASPYFVVKEYRSRRNGRAHSDYGFLEQVLLTYQWRGLKLDLLLLAVQDWNGRWNNVFSTSERLSFRLLPQLFVGVYHQLVQSLLDDDTGVLLNVGFFDGRDSRIAGFVQWQI